MKKILALLIVSTFICQFAQAQNRDTSVYYLKDNGQLVNHENLVRFDIPNGAEQITKQQAVTHAYAKYNDSRAINLYKGDRSDYIYKVNDIIISLKLPSRPGRVDLRMSYLEFKNALTGGESNVGITPSHPAGIIRINADTVITYYPRSGKVDYCYFFYFHGNSHASTRVAGELEYDPADDAKAQGILDRLLKSIRFLD